MGTLQETEPPASLFLHKFTTLFFSFPITKELPETLCATGPNNVDGRAMATQHPHFAHEPRPSSSSLPLKIYNAKIQGVIWRAQTADPPRPTLAKLNHQRPEVNTVTPAAIDHIIDPAKLFAHQDIELGWRLEEGDTLFTTLHRVVPGPIDSAGHGVSFKGNLDWTKPITELVSRFNQFADHRLPAAPRSFYQPDYVEPPSPRVWSPSRGRLTTQGFLSGPAVGRATTSSQLQERRRLQASERLVEARQQYALQLYRETGDTGEMLKAMDQTQAVAASALQHLAQQ